MRRRNQIVWVAILGVVIIVAAVKILMPSQKGMVFQPAEADQKIAVHITGAVKTPGLVYLPLDARMGDALAEIELLEEADSEGINLAQKLKDGQMIRIPFKGENVEFADGVSGEGEGGSSAAGGTPSGVKPSGKININTASSSRLQELPGVGPVLAERIIVYRRENGLFMSLEELKNVQGIGDKRYEDLVDQITLGP